MSYKDVWISLLPVNTSNQIQARSILDESNDPMWTVRVCRELDCEDLSSASFLIDYALENSSIYSPISAKVRAQLNLSASEKEFIFIRQELLQLRQRLKCYAKLSPRSVQKNIYPIRNFLSTDFLSLAASLAIHNEIEALEALMHLHSDELLPYRFSLLDLIAETISPSLYEKILPCVNNGTETNIYFLNKAIETTDWCYTIHNTEPQGNQSSLQKKLLSEPFPELSSVVTTWYLRRAQCIEMITGNPSLAIELLELAFIRDIPDVFDFLAELNTLKDVIECHVQHSYLSTQGKNQLVSLTLDIIREWSPTQIFDFFLSECTSETMFLENTRNFVVSYIQRMSDVKVRQSAPESPVNDAWHSFYEYLIAISADSLALVCVLFEQSIPSLPDNRRIFTNDIDALDTLIKCAYASDKNVDIALMRRMVSCSEQLIQAIRTKWSSFDEKSHDPYTELCHKGALFRHHVDALRTLSKYKIDLSLFFVIKTGQNIEAQEDIINLLCTDASTIKQLPKSELHRRYEDIIELYPVLFPLVDLPSHLTKFFSILLHAGEFRIAAELVQQKAIYSSFTADEFIQQIVIYIEECIENATSVSHSNKLLQSAFNCARDTIAIFKSPQLRDFIAFIEGLWFLDDCQIADWLPKEIYHMGDSFRIMEAILQKAPMMYRRYELLITVSHEFARGQTDFLLLDQHIYKMCASCAFEAQDYSFSYKLIHVLVSTWKEGQQYSCALLSTLADEPEYNDANAKLTLWRWVMKYGNEEELCNALRHYCSYEVNDPIATTGRQESLLNGPYWSSTCHHNTSKNIFQYANTISASIDNARWQFENNMYERSKEKATENLLLASLVTYVGTVAGCDNAASFAILFSLLFVSDETFLRMLWKESSSLRVPLLYCLALHVLMMETETDKWPILSMKMTDVVLAALSINRANNAGSDFQKMLLLREFMCDEQQQEDKIKLNMSMKLYQDIKSIWPMADIDVEILGGATTLSDKLDLLALIASSVSKNESTDLDVGFHQVSELLNWFLQFVIDHAAEISVSWSQLSSVTILITRLCASHGLQNETLFLMFGILNAMDIDCEFDLTHVQNPTLKVYISVWNSCRNDGNQNVLKLQSAVDSSFDDLEAHPDEIKRNSYLHYLLCFSGSMGIICERRPALYSLILSSLKRHWERLGKVMVNDSLTEATPWTQMLFNRPDLMTMSVLSSLIDYTLNSADTLKPKPQKATIDLLCDYQKIHPYMRAKAKLADLGETFFRQTSKQVNSIASTNAPIDKELSIRCNIRLLQDCFIQKRTWEDMECQVVLLIGMCRNTYKDIETVIAHCDSYMHRLPLL